MNEIETETFRKSVENMASIDILGIDDDSSDSIPSEEYSMLHEVEESPYKNGVTNHINFDLTNMQSTINETACDGNTEVSSQISKLISNNLSMKEALDKTNSLMKEQLSNLPSLIDSKLEQQKKNLQKAEEKITSLEKEKAILQSKAEEKITSLEKENAILQNKLDSLLNMSQSKDKDFCVKCETLKESTDILFGVENFNNIDDETICNEVKMFQTNLEQNLTSICEHLKELLKNKMDENEKKILKTFANLLAFKIGNFNGIIQTDEETGYEIVLQEVKQKGSVNGYSLVNSEAQQQLKNLEECLKSKEEELIMLRKEKDQLSETVKGYSLKMQALEQELNTHLESMKRKLVTESSVSEKYKERCESLQQQLKNYQEKFESAKMSENQIIQDLLQENSNLKESVTVEKMSYQRVKDELSETMTNKDKLQEDYDRVSQLLEIGSRDAKSKIEEMQAEMKRKEKEQQETIDHLTAQLYRVQDLFNESKSINAELNLKLEQFRNEAETIPILKQQIEVYKKDYEISEMKKQSVLYELEKLSNELKNLKENSESNSQTASESSSSNYNSFLSRRKADESAVIACVCPICGAGFTSIKATENHVARCLKKS